ncbi:hypothetical protein QR680_003912 [Steinernema hermaphroditum]|uniref:Uncharacterized protein n=1 Tax=Steinernema hermaphroditum TaxID=289476 RepID=A0AA39HPB5_9BILA|nr:hypothetical protein QR680_003912 [Steinernema hermaphroditum]
MSREFQIKINILDCERLLQNDLEAIGIDIWQVKSGSIFDNILVADSIEDAQTRAAETFNKLKEEEKTKKEAHDEEERKKREEEEKKRKEEEDANKEEDAEKDDAEEEEEKADEKDHDEL